MKRDKFEGKLDVSEAVAAAGDELSPSSMDMCGFGEEIKHSGGTLLLSVEEVLRTLEPEPLTQEDCGAILQPSQDSSGNLNGPFVCSANSSTNTTSTDSPRPLPSLPLNSSEVLAPQHPNSQHQHSHPSSGMSCSAVTPRVPRSSRKRSRSESDSEKIQPLPISSIIPLGASAPVVIKCESKVPPVMPHMASVPNGGGLSKVGKTLVVSNNKNVKKSQDHHGPKRHTPRPNRAPQSPRTKQKSGLPAARQFQGAPQKWFTRSPRRRRAASAAGPLKTQVFLHAAANAAPATLIARLAWTVYAGAARTPTWPMVRKSWRPLPFRRKLWSRHG
ncbi:hypothetical protein AALO_G00213720 [Alosa alosa]|uniref:Uncharacterized protein n=1 Tax=Alosa alosa TaxID=278164 RepID=A0AAV6G4X0_9TELE|nr:hypothetical protein AALO_G00213720 [Alosa alosa]